MATVERRPSISGEDLANLEEAVRNALNRTRDLEAMRLAAERMDRMREEMRQRVGEGEWAVPLTRETRDEG